MEYRRFGKTEKEISVITLGGMRFKQAWNEPRNVVDKETQDHCTQMVDLALKNGINHFETAYGYMKSEHAFGKTLHDELKLDRSSYYLMTKGREYSADDMRRLVEQQLKNLKTDYFDFYGWHGLNSREIFNNACKSNGAVEELLKMKEEGIIKHVGFSTHASVDVIEDAILTDYFEFVNLHYYYFNQTNQRAVDLAKEKDLGVFIISPNDKGGQLYKAPQKVKNAIPHSTPIQWNARFCLNTPGIHTLSFGMTEEAHFNEMKGIFDFTQETLEQDQKTKQVLDDMENDDPYAKYKGTELRDHSGELNIEWLLRWRKLWKCYDMLDFAKYRYKELKTPNDWVPGVYATAENISKIDFSKVSDSIPLKEMLLELHDALYVNPDQKRFDPKTLKLNLGEQ
ncbi:aldo/keto reductase [Plebeiibacterium sediminum]|uniref:Aldo/keto reductase n=1 Tax=Plebeiibacterium sediminum TaxID=2992112 RepID=A0AAE3SE36_9BACT|nr:aldo/keto reductase [Plebeiobacterium sediminum]MCW3786088.1 aldo/keto reductase [Plebeiobacterium sediminum]